MLDAQNSITPIRSNYHQPGPLNLPSPGLSPIRNEYITNVVPTEIIISNGDDFNPKKVNGIAMESEMIQAIPGRLFTDEKLQFDEQEQLSPLMSPIRNERADHEGNVSMRSLHALSLLPDTPPTKKYQNSSAVTTPRDIKTDTMSTPDHHSRLTQPSSTKSPAHTLSATPLRSIMKHSSTPTSHTPIFGSDARERNRSLIFSVQNKFAGGGGETSPVRQRGGHRPHEQQESSLLTLDTTVTSSADSAEYSYELKRAVLANTARNSEHYPVMPVSSTPHRKELHFDRGPRSPLGTTSSISALNYYSDKLREQSVADDLSFVSALPNISSSHRNDVSHLVGDHSPQRRGQHVHSTRSNKQPLGLAVGATYTLTVDPHGSPVFVPVAATDVKSSATKHSLRHSLDRDDIHANHHHVGHSSNFERRHSTPPHRLAASYPPVWPHGGAVDDSFVSYSRSEPAMLSYLPDYYSAPHSTGKLRRRSAPRHYQHFDDHINRHYHDYHHDPYYVPPPTLPYLNPLQIDPEQFLHSAAFSEERAFVLWKEAVATTRDKYYYANSRFREPPLPQFTHQLPPEVAEFTRHIEVPNTYPPPNTPENWRLRHLQQHFGASLRSSLPKANVYSRNISKTLLTPNRVSASRESGSTPFGKYGASGSPFSESVFGATPTKGLGDQQQTPPSRYFRDRLSQRNLSSVLGSLE